MTVKAFGPDGTATRTFNLTVTNGTACAGNDKGLQIRADKSPWADVPKFVAVGDFNNDGKQDIATANYFFKLRSLSASVTAGEALAARQT